MAAESHAAVADEVEAPPKKRKRKVKSAPVEPPRRRVEDRYADAIRREVLGIVILASSLCVMLSLASFEPSDVSSAGEAARSGRAANLIGPVGAHVADVLLEVVGLAAFLLPVTLALPGLFFMVGRRISLRLGDAIGYPVLVAAGAMLAHLLIDGRLVMGHLAGGITGATAAELIQAMFGRTGAYIIVYALLALTFILTTHISLVGLLRRIVVPAVARLGDVRALGADFARGIPSTVRRQFAAWIDARRQRSTARREARAALVAEKERSELETERVSQPEPRKIRWAKAPSSGPVVVSPGSSSDHAPKQVGEEPTLDNDTFSLGGLPASPSDGFALGDGVADIDDGVSANAHVFEADDAGAELDDPLDRVALEGNTDTVAAPAVRGAPPPEGATPIRPVVKQRQAGRDSADHLEILMPHDKVIRGYVRPPLNLLDYDDPGEIEVDTVRLQAQADRLVEALETYKIQGRVTEIHPGPVVTMFEFEPAPGVRISRIAGLSDDLAMALKAQKVRIVAPIPGKGVVGFEVPNEHREMVFLKEIIGSKAFRSRKNELPMSLGKDIHGHPAVTDLARMPHLLVAGTTGSGKSVGVNGMITSLIYHAGPEDVRMIMVDPKMLELSIYEGIPHLLLPVVTDSKKAAMALKWAVDEMERRYQLMKDAGVRDIRGYNVKLLGRRRDAAEQQALAALDYESLDEDGDAPAAVDEVPSKLPYIVVVIDEFADLMMVAGKEVEYCVARIAQKARAAGIHLILATQRPSTDVITGVIKANFPTRIAFQVSSGIDSRTVLSTNGAESLLGRGDMLFMPPGTSRLRRVHGAYVSEDEIHKVVEFVRAQGDPEYLDESVLEASDDKGADEEEDCELDESYEEAVRVVARDGRASTSHLQRRLSLGYNRAARIIDQMERDGLVGPGEGAKPRQIDRAAVNELVARWDGL